MTNHSNLVFQALNNIHRRPEPFETYTAETLWDDEHISASMLAFHLDPDSAPASRPHAFIKRSADWIARRFDFNKGPRVGDFGCGPGLYASHFARAGARVTGIDFSRRSISHADREAQDHGWKIEYVCANYLEYQSLTPFDLVTLIYCDLCALSPVQRQSLLKRFHEMLADGGSVLLDVFTTSAFAERQETHDHGSRFMHGFWAPGEYWGFQNAFKYEPEMVVLDKYTIIEPEQTRTVYNWLQYFRREELERELEQSGFKIAEVLGDVAGAPYEESGQVMAVVARKV